MMTRETVVPVVDGSRYLGLIGLGALASVPRATWAETTVDEVMDDRAPVGRPSWTVEEALRSMQAADLSLLPVVDEEGRFVGVVTTGDIVRLDEILEQTEQSERSQHDDH